MVPAYPRQNKPLRVKERERGGTWRYGTALLYTSSLCRFVGRAHRTNMLRRRHRGRIAGAPNRALSLRHVRPRAYLTVSFFCSRCCLASRLG